MWTQLAVILVLLTAVIVQNVHSSSSSSSDPDAVPEPEVLFTHTHRVRRDTENLEYGPGIFFEDISAPVFYEYFVPVIYNFEIPNWNVLATKVARLVKLLEYNTSDCDVNPYAFTSTELREDDILQAIILCKNATRANQEAHNQIASVIKTLQPFSLLLENSPFKIKDTNTEEEQQLRQLDEEQNIVNELKFSCSDINPHFQHFSASPKEFENYIQNLKFCSFKNIIITKSIKAKEKINSIVSNFFPTLLNGKASSKSYVELKRSSILRNFISSYEINVITQMNLWNSAISTCRSNLIPATLVPKNMLKSSLVKMMGQILEKDSNININLSIPFDKLNIERYYKHKLADCIFLTNHTFTLRILVPVMKTTANYVLRRYYPIPFLQKVKQDSESNKTIANITTIMSNYVSCELVNVGRYFVEDLKTNNSLVRSSCRGNELCKIPDRSEQSTPPSCILEILQNNQYDFELIRKVCSIKCEPVPNKLLPLIQRKEASRFVVLGNSSMSITIQCEYANANNALEKQVIQLKENATLLISLPCSCSIALDSYEIIQPQFPCQKDVNMLKFGFVKSIHALDLEFEASALTSMNPNQYRTKIDSVFERGQEDPVSPLKRDILYSKYISLDRKYKELKQSFLNLNETMYQRLLSEINTNVSVNPADGENEFPSNSSYNNGSHHNFYDALIEFSEKTTDFSKVFWVLITAIIVIIMTLGILSYFVYRLYRWKQVEPFKPDRAQVYNPAME